MIYSERVKQLREMRRLTQAGLAEYVPALAQDQVSRIERHGAQPDDEAAALLALSCGVTVEFLQREPHPSLAVHSPHLRARGRLTEREKNSALQWLRFVDEQHQRMRPQATAIPVKLPRLWGMKPREAAARIRDVLGFDAAEPLPFLLLAVERAGVTLLGVPVAADALDAFCAWRDDEPVIGLLAGAPPDRMRWSVAHELGHLALHRRDESGKKVEAEADEFAAELLTPLDAIKDQLPARPTLNNLTMLKTQWGVSIKSLVRRAKELGVVDQDRAISLYKQISSRGWNRMEPGYVPPEKPRAFRKLAEICYGPGPNVERLAKEAGWSAEVAIDVLRQHATTEELPPARPAPRPHTTTGSNVIRFPTMLRQ